MEESFRLLEGLGPDILIAVPVTDTTTQAKFEATDPSAGIAPELATDDQFQVLRLLGTLKFVGPENQEYFRFAPPARMQVHFTANDLNRAARRGKPLALGYWDGAHWERFPPGNVPADPNATGDDWAYFLIQDIIDPPIAWGT